MMKDNFIKYAKTISLDMDVILQPKDLDQNYKQHILNVVKEKNEGSCISEIGYVIKVVRLRKIISDYISSIIPVANFLVEMELFVFYPSVGMKLEVNIDIIFSHGIFINKDKIRILVPINTMEGWEMVKDFSSQRMVHASTQKVLKKGDLIFIELMECRFEKDGFSCIGKLLLE